MATDPIHPNHAPAHPALDAPLSDLSVEELESGVARMCGAYGTVVKVAIHLSQAHLKIRAFALVDMADAGEAERLAIAFGRKRMGAAVLLLLDPRTVSSA